MPSKGSRPNPSGVHFLADRRIVDGLIDSCPVGDGDLVLELGAGHGAITVPLTRTGAEVVAVERDPEFARGLRARTADTARLRIVTADIRTFPLPAQRFSVIASIPYAISTTVLRRLLTPHRTALDRAALVVEWGFAKRISAAVPRTAELAWWSARFTIRLRKRVPAACFSPAPRVDSAHLVIERTAPGGKRFDRALWTLLDAAYRAQSAPLRQSAGRVLPYRNPNRVLRAAGLDPDARADTVRPSGWADLARRLAADDAIAWPPLPKALRE
ncbi:ribosomal RNA small subunit methyltransferase A [Amycolatopsis sp. CA-230715]|uniref:ribosomal RNA small subunit methyltransferase A n=1 Tax=Amycolatopsis sp. CA-230715 TaxID=2745196 RepID=UPI001C33152B|nr:rRNA adenine dimethyltransferase family protein [Amycolatopsis sp. CA-230715]QWF78570.1 rRNA adenine N-6-methyltransferase [Amycolatopsis sp. CA-230715]